jgi:YD repeat-containing protein
MQRSVILFGFLGLCASAASSVSAETRTYSYNARGELVGSSVSGGPANGVQTTVVYDKAGNRTSYQTVGSAAKIRFPIPIAVPINGISIITIPE